LGDCPADRVLTALTGSPDRAGAGDTGNSLPVSEGQEV
jgi:hypothetical protein